MLYPAPELTKSLLAAGAVVALTAGGAQAEIAIATAGPMTGQYAIFGDQMKRGAEMAVKDINAAGGVLGEELVLEVGDDACDPKQAVAVANQMVNAGVVFMAGHFCSGSSIPASAVYNEEGILQISPASTNPQLTEQGFDNVFRVCGRDDQQGTFAANYVVDNNVGSKVAVLHDKTAYGKGLADEFKKQLNARGVEETMYEAITAGDKDFTALITKMKEAGVDLIYLGGYHTEAGLISRQAKEQGINATMMSGDGLVTDEYWAITGDTGQGTLMTFSPDPRKNEAAATDVGGVLTGPLRTDYPKITPRQAPAWKPEAALNAPLLDFQVDLVLALAHKLGMKGSDLAQAAAVETVGDAVAFVEPQLDELKRLRGD
jgi:branched-chain amino acid transport system substrate-binding protein